MVGPLAYMLKNRFYVGEIAYHGESHKGEHEPILDRDLFDTVQARLAEGAAKRRSGDRRRRDPLRCDGLQPDTGSASCLGGSRAPARPRLNPSITILADCNRRRAVSCLRCILIRKL
jgi:hypothetical protein